MIIDVAEVALVLIFEPGQLGDAPHQTRKRVPLRRHRLAHSNQQPLHTKDLLQLLVVGSNENLILELVDAVIERREDWEKAVDQAVDNSVEQQRRLVDR